MSDVLLPRSDLLSEATFVRGTVVYSHPDWPHHAYPLVLATREPNEAPRAVADEILAELDGYPADLTRADRTGGLETIVRIAKERAAMGDDEEDDVNPGTRSALDALSRAQFRDKA